MSDFNLTMLNDVEFFKQETKEMAKLIEPEDNLSIDNLAVYLSFLVPFLAGKYGVGSKELNDNPNGLNQLFSMTDEELIKLVPNQ